MTSELLEKSKQKKKKEIKNNFIVKDLQIVIVNILKHSLSRICTACIKLTLVLVTLQP